MKAWFVVAALLLASAAWADALDDLRLRLAPSSAMEPLRATALREVRRERKDQPTQEGAVRFTLTASAAGLQIEYAPTELQRAAAEKSQTDPDQPQPVSMALQNLDIAGLAAMLDAGPALLGLLEGGSLIRQSPGEYQGLPAQLLEVSLPARVPSSEMKYMKTAQSSARLWLDAAGLPLCLEHQLQLKGSFLFISFEASRIQRSRYQRAGGRWVVLREELRRTGSGLGQSGSSVTTTTLKLGSN